MITPMSPETYTSTRKKARSVALLIQADRNPVSYTHLDGDTVTFHYNRHEDDQYVEETLPVMDFIKRLIRHIDVYKRQHWENVLPSMGRH